MAYRILKSNGQLLATIPDGTINTNDSSLGLPGRNYAGYGQTLDTNFVHITENFAKATPPANPLQGQLWYNTNANLLYVCPADGTTNAADWVPIAVAGGNTTTTFGTVNVNGNLNANNVVAVNSVQAANGAFTNISVTANANILNSTITTANISTLNTQIITTGANTTTGTMNGTWTITGGLSGNSLVVANGNVYTTGIRTDGYYYSNGSPFNGTYTNGNVFDYLTGANSTARFTGNIAPNLIVATGNITTTGNISATGNITGNYIIGNGSLLTGVAVSGGTTIVNGNSNVNIPAANGNVTISSAGNANIIIVTGTGANIAGTLRSTGNANVGNLGTTGVFATTLSSTGNANVGGTLSVSGNITGGNLLGTLANGNSNISIPSANGNILFSTFGYEVGRFGTDLVFYVGATSFYDTGINARSLFNSSTKALSAVTTDVTGLGFSAIVAARQNTDGTVIEMWRGASIVGGISVTTTTTTYGTTSDHRLKDNIQPLTGSGSFIDALKPRTWTWVQNGENGVGFVAHEVAEVSPGSVAGAKDAVNEDGIPRYQTMEYGSAEFIANMIAELQELRRRVSQLEANNP
jgi:hypothetical protein